MDDAGHISPRDESDELVEIDIPLSGGYSDDSCLERRRPGRRTTRAPLPRWAWVDLDQVLPDPAIEAALRDAGIDRIYSPSRGFLATSGIGSLAMIQPIHVIRRSDRWYCLAGWALLREVQETMRAPRVFPVCVHGDVSAEEMRGYALTEQITLRVRYQMSSDALIGFINILLQVARKNTSHFMRLKSEQWGALVGKSLRWLRQHHNERSNNG